MGLASVPEVSPPTTDPEGVLIDLTRIGLGMRPPSAMVLAIRAICSGVTWSFPCPKALVASATGSKRSPGGIVDESRPAELQTDLGEHDVVGPHEGMEQVGRRGPGRKVVGGVRNGISVHHEGAGGGCSPILAGQRLDPGVDGGREREGLEG